MSGCANTFTPGFAYSTQAVHRSPLSLRYLYWNSEVRYFDLCQTINSSKVSVALLACCLVVGWSECRWWVGIVMIWSSTCWESQAVLQENVWHEYWDVVNQSWFILVFYLPIFYTCANTYSCIFSLRVLSQVRFILSIVNVVHSVSTAVCLLVSVCLSGALHV